MDTTVAEVETEVETCATCAHLGEEAQSSRNWHRYEEAHLIADREIADREYLCNRSLYNWKGPAMREVVRRNHTCSHWEPMLKVNSGPGAPNTA